MWHRRAPALVLTAAAAVLAVGPAARGGERRVELRLQERDPKTGEQSFRRATLDPTRAAVVVVDMWDRHWCETYTRRVGEMVPRMNQALDAARKLGILVVFAPSDVLGPYKDAPQRKAMLAVPKAPLPKPSGFEPPAPPWSRSGGCECGPDRPCKSRRAWSRQHPALRMADGDLLADCNNGGELYSLCKQRAIDTLLYMGVASNMCVMHRGCGMRNMKRHGLNVLFAADLVNAIAGNGYDPDRRRKDDSFTPAKGTAVVQRHLERHVAPSFESRQLLPAADARRHAVFVIAEAEYGTKDTLPAFASKHLARDCRCTFVHASPKDRNDVPGLAALYDADLLVLSMRRRALPVAQMDHLERYVRAGKPLVAVRVSCVPFAAGQRPKGHVVWPSFDREVLGCHYRGYDRQSRTTGCDVWAVAEAADHPILKGVAPATFHSRSWLYKMQPLAKTAAPLLVARWADGQPAEPVAWTHAYHGGRVFYTTLGHPDDFKLPQFNRLLANAIRWALGEPQETPR